MTEPNPRQTGRCPSIDPHDTLQCGRLIHEDDQCQYGGIAWKKGSPRHVAPGAAALLAAANAWRDEGRHVMFNRAGDDLSPEQRVGKWLRARALRAAEMKPTPNCARVEETP